MNMLAAFDDTINMAAARKMKGEGELSLSHLKDMRKRITPEFSEAKLGRWLGWAQCAVVAAGAATLHDMKEINRWHS